MISLTLIDKYGRKSLMFVGSLGLIAALALASEAFFSERTGIVVPVYLIVHCVFAFSQERLSGFHSKFPIVRAHGQHSVVSRTDYGAIIAYIFRISPKLGGGITFAFFVVMMVYNYFRSKMMPETKGNLWRN
jgi:hypothetical protein